MTASELVERLQKIIKEEGDFEVEWRDLLSVAEEYWRPWSYPLVTVEVNKLKKIIEVY